jgi:hypothetical protein
VAVQKLGQGLAVCRCVVYRWKEADNNATIEHEFLNPGITSIKGQKWPSKNNPLFQEVLELRESLKIEDAIHDPVFPGFHSKSRAGMFHLFLVISTDFLPKSSLGNVGTASLLDPILPLGKARMSPLWTAVATQIGVALIQFKPTLIYRI